MGASVRVRVVFMTILPLISMEFCILDIFLCPEIARETVGVLLGVPLVHSLSGYLWLVQWVLGPWLGICRSISITQNRV